MKKYKEELLALLARISSILSDSEQAEVIHLIEHNESGIALETLAWIIVEEDKKIPKEILDDIMRLGDGIVDRDHMPKNLKDFVS